jgi:hypothetical protein
MVFSEHKVHGFCVVVVVVVVVTGVVVVDVAGQALTPVCGWSELWLTSGMKKNVIRRRKT